MKLKERRMNLEEYPDVMTFTDLCEYFNVSKETGYKIIHDENFPKIKMHGGRKFIIIKSALQFWQHKTALKDVKL
jgi:excisionase family DNA binding protein